jgi:hypothetical protein
MTYFIIIIIIIIIDYDVDKNNNTLLETFITNKQNKLRTAKSF